MHDLSVLFTGQEGEEQIDSGDNEDMPKDNEPLREQVCPPFVMIQLNL